MRGFMMETRHGHADADHSRGQPKPGTNLAEGYTACAAREIASKPNRWHAMAGSLGQETPLSAYGTCFGIVKSLGSSEYAVAPRRTAAKRRTSRQRAVSLLSMAFKA